MALSWHFTCETRLGLLQGVILSWYFTCEAGQALTSVGVDAVNACCLAVAGVTHALVVVLLTVRT